MTEPDAYLVEYREVSKGGSRLHVTMASLEPAVPFLILPEEADVESRTLIRATPLYARQVAVAGLAQGQCSTTLTHRFWISNCECGTYEENLGPCMTWNEGNEVGRCVYCDHDIACHRKLSAALYAATHWLRTHEAESVLRAAIDAARSGGQKNG